MQTHTDTFLRSWFTNNCYLCFAVTLGWENIKIWRWSYDHSDDTGSASHATGCICKNSLTTSTMAACLQYVTTQEYLQFFFHETGSWGNCLSISVSHFWLLGNNNMLYIKIYMHFHAQVNYNFVKYIVEQNFSKKMQRKKNLHLMLHRFFFCKSHSFQDD